MDAPQGFAQVLFSWRRLLLRATVAGAVASVIVSLLLPPSYEASAVLAPPEDMDAGLGLMSVVNQLSATAGIGRTRNLLRRTADVDVMIGVLKSRRIRGEVVDRFELVKHYRSKSREHAIKTLGTKLQVGTTAEGFIDVRVEARNRQLAADLANAFVEALDRYNRSTSVEDARRTREFIMTCLEENRARLDAATDSLRRFQETHGAVQLEAQGKVTVEALAELEAEKTRLQIEKGVLQHYARVDQPRILEIDAQVVEIEKRLQRLHGSSRVNESKGSNERGTAGQLPPQGTEVLLRLGDLPQLALNYAELQREVLAQSKVYEFLTAQFEEARIREARDLQTVKVVDEAVPPIRKSKPRRSVIVILSTGLAFATAMGLAFAAEGTRSLARSNPGLLESRELRWVLRASDALHRWGRVAIRSATRPIP